MKKKPEKTEKIYDPFEEGLTEAPKAPGKEMTFAVNPEVFDPEKLPYKSSAGRPKRQPGEPKKVNRKNYDPIKIAQTQHFIVAMLTLNGVDVVDIAGAMGVKPEEIRSKYKFELEHGKMVCLANIAGKMYEKAMEGNVQAGMFFLKTKGNYAEASTNSDDLASAKDIDAITRAQRLGSLMLNDPKYAEMIKFKKAEKNMLERNPLPEEPSKRN
jgi:hypothetical protein